MPPTRRDWLRAHLLGAAGVWSTRALGGCGESAEAGRDGSAAGDGGAGLPPPDHAIAVFDPRPTSALIWALAPATGIAELELLDPPRALPLPLDDTGVGALRVDGLAPGTRHAYRVVFASGVIAEGTFTTPPDDDADAPARFAVSADVGPDTELYDIFDAVPDDLDFFVMLGDWPYADKAPAAVTLDEYRAKHRAVRTPPPLQRFLARTAVHATHDDHEVVDNWDGGFRAASPAREAAALTAWDQYNPRHDAAHVYRRWRWGRHVELFLLDTRRHRSDNAAPDDATKTLLGAEQLAWLREGLAASTATFCVVLSSVPLDFTGSVDSWESFTTERALAFGDLPGGATVIVISADRHYFAKHVHGSGLVEYLCGPLAAGGNMPPDPLPAGVQTWTRARNFLDVTLVPGATPRLELTARDQDGVAFFTETIDPAA